VSTRITITVDDRTTAVLDALAFLHDYGGCSPRASLLRSMVTGAAATAYRRDPAVREMVDLVVHDEAASAARHPSRHLHVVR
jgi:hypothetical protein